jgi:hypothetical protein
VFEPFDELHELVVHLSEHFDVRAKATMLVVIGPHVFIDHPIEIALK